MRLFTLSLFSPFGRTFQDGDRLCKVSFPVVFFGSINLKREKKKKILTKCGLLLPQVKMFLILIHCKVVQLIFCLVSISFKGLFSFQSKGLIAFHVLIYYIKQHFFMFFNLICSRSF